jgi:ribosomal protein S18 acetylase RimI-like enzyme
MKPNITISEATYDDIPFIIELLFKDPLGQKREDCNSPFLEKYYSAFREIDRDSNNFLVVIKEGQKVIGTSQLTIITHLTYQGGKRGQIEGVRIDESYRGHGLGKKMIEWLIGKASQNNCHLVQLTMDKKRLETIGFYQNLGFTASHEGMKFHL